MSTTDSSTPASTDPHVLRGAYLAHAGDCIACHTASGGQPFAGGLPMHTPFGTLLSSNITPDRDTGIGAWTDADFVRAVKHGIGRNGEHLYPAMPYPSYAKVSDQDVLDIRAYLNTLPAVHHSVDADTLPFPFNIRLLMIGWNLLFFHDTPYQPDPGHTAQWNRGALLVEGLGHCASCHSAKNALGGDEAFLEGGALDGWYAPEITANDHAGVGRWSEAEIAEYLEKGGNSHSVAAGPMAEAVTDSLQYLTPADAQDIAIFLKSVPGSGSTAPTPLAANDAAMVRGRRVFVANCAACHTSSGAGVPDMIPALRDSAGVRAPDSIDMLRTILAGSRGAVTQSNPTGAAMPAFSLKLTDGEIADVATYVRNSFGNAAPAVQAKAVAAARKQLVAPAALAQSAP